ECDGRGVIEKNTIVVMKDVVSPSVIEEPVVVEKQSLLVDTSIPNAEKRGKRFMPVESIRAISERFANSAYGFFLGKRVAYPIITNYVRNTWGKYGLVKSILNSSIGSSYARVMIELRADVELKDTIIVVMPKIAGEEECPKNIGSGEAKNVKKPSQTPQGVSVGGKVGFKPTKEYRSVSKKPTANTSDNKMKVVEPTKEVSNSNPFDVLNSIVNDVEKIEKLIIDGKVTLVDDDCKPLKQVDYPERVGFSAKSLLEQWSDSYVNGDYDEDPYDDDMYEVQYFIDKIQDIFDNLDISHRKK
ncbi:hypothetical protein Tco_1339979, partial [Tanacetum coccineum]